MYYLKVIFIALIFVFANTAMAGTSLLQNGTIKSVDVQNNTFTVEFADSGITRTFSFPKSISFTDDGVALVDKSAFKAGQSVRLNFEAKKSTNFNFNPVRRTKKEYTLKSMTVD